MKTEPETDDLEVEAGDIFAFDLPPVTETETGYLDDEPEASDEEAGEMSHDRPGIDGESEAGAAAQPERITGEEYRGTLDEKGGAFDPALHSSPPEKTPSGRWKRIPKALREAGIKKPGSDDIIEPNASARLEAQKMALLYGTLHTIPFGAAGAPIKEEVLPLVDSIESFFNTHGIVKSPPGIDLALSMFVYSAGVAQRPTTIEKTRLYMATAIAWFKDKFKGKKPKPKTETKTDNEKPTEKGEMKGAESA